MAILSIGELPESVILYFEREAESSGLSREGFIRAVLTSLAAADSDVSQVNDIDLALMIEILSGELTWRLRRANYVLRAV
jgi:hypothetical protein